MSWKKISVDRDAIEITPSSTFGDHARKTLTDEAQASIADLDLDSMTPEQLHSTIREHEMQRDRMTPRIRYTDIADQLRHALSDDHHHSESSLESLKYDAPHLFKEDGSLDQEAVRRPHALRGVSLSTFTRFMNNHALYHMADDDYQKSWGGVPNHRHPGDSETAWAQPDPADPLTQINDRVHILQGLRSSYQIAQATGR